jgi:hypothetical protein
MYYTLLHVLKDLKAVTVFCPLYQDTRDQLRVNGRLDFKALLTAVERAKKMTKWQFWLAEELIGEQGLGLP